MERKKKPHVMIIPHPAQGHVAPLMKLAYKLANHGIKVTVVNIHVVHERITAAMPMDTQDHIPVSLVSISDGLSFDEDQKHPWVKFCETMERCTPGHLQDLIESMNGRSDGDEKISCVIGDASTGWALEVAAKMGIKRAAFAAFGLANLAILLHAPKLVEAGIIDVDGLPMKDEFVCLSKEIPPWHSKELFWSNPSDPEVQKFAFAHFVLNVSEPIRNSNWLLTNSFYELEPSACDLFPNSLPIGPLLARDHPGPLPGNFWPEDPRCIGWLDKQPAGSVIYAAFGSTGAFSQQQFDELALGLELTGLPFLWVVRSDSTKGKVIELPNGFTERTANLSLIVEWAPQEKVLSHPSVACFFSHCGWNSTVEGVSMGVPILCWPSFYDRYHNKSYICDSWRVGLRLVPDETGIVTRHEIRKKIEKLISDDEIKANALKLKGLAKMSVSEGGSSFRNFTSFVEQLKQ